VLVLLIGMGVVACGGEATPGLPTPGGWVASIDIGELRFIVSPDSTGISEVSLYFPEEFECGAHTMTNSIHGYKNPDLWLITDGRFTVEPLATGYWVIDVQGEFDETGTHASGTWSISAEGVTCQAGTWEASPSS
jgi:hypothetical protein